jgi:ferredoxin
MAMMYNPEDEDYLGEVFVRQEISRVFDVCLSCRGCIDTCGVFPSLVDIVERSALTDSGMLTPIQQDDILDACHLCMQCVVQCPYGDVASHHTLSSVESIDSVHFPQMVIRHRAMLWSQGDIDFRDRCAALFLSYSVRLMHGVRLIRSVVRKPKMRAANGDVVVFPTCVVEQHHPQLVDEFTTVCHAIDVRAAGRGSFVCCGAPELYSGNLSRFRRIARKNSAAISRMLSRGQTVVVGQSRCVAVMKEFYPGVARHRDAQNVTNNIVGMTEYLGQQCASQPLAQLPQCAPDTRVVVLESSTQRLAGALMASPVESSDTDNDSVATTRLLELCGAKVDTLTYSSFADTAWSAQRRFDDTSVSETRKLVAAIDDALAAAPCQVLLGESCLTNAFLSENVGRPVDHPVSFLARQIPKM